MKSKDVTLKKVLDEVVRENRSRPYEYWRDHVGETFHFEKQANVTRYQVEMSVVWDDRPGGDIRVIVAADDGGWRAFVPKTDSFIIRPDGTFVE